MIYITGTPATEANAQPLLLWDNVLLGGTIDAAFSPDGAYPKANALTETTYDFWQPTAYPGTLGVILAAGTTADCMFVASHTLSGHLVEVVRKNAGVWVTVASVTPASNDPFLVIFPQATYTSWGIRIAGGLVGVVMIGKRLTIPGGVVPDYSPIWASREVTMFPGVSNRGQFTGQRIQKTGATVEAGLAPVTYTFASVDLAPFRAHHDAGKAFVWASAPSVFPQDVAYCWAEQVLQTEIMAGGHLCSLSISARAYAE